MFLIICSIVNWVVIVVIMVVINGMVYIGVRVRVLSWIGGSSVVDEIFDIFFDKVDINVMVLIVFNILIMLFCRFVMRKFFWNLLVIVELWVLIRCMILIIFCCVDNNVCVVKIMIIIVVRLMIMRMKMVMRWMMFVNDSMWLFYFMWLLSLVELLMVLIFDFNLVKLGGIRGLIWMLIKLGIGSEFGMMLGFNYGFKSCWVICLLMSLICCMLEVLWMILMISFKWLFLKLGFFGWILFWGLSFMVMVFVNLVV